MAPISRLVSLDARATVRPSAERWAQVNTLMRQLERVVHAHAVLDQRTERGTLRVQRAAEAEDALADLQIILSREISRVTCEELHTYLERRKRKDKV